MSLYCPWSVEFRSWHHRWRGQVMILRNYDPICPNCTAEIDRLYPLHEGETEEARTRFRV